MATKDKIPDTIAFSSRVKKVYVIGPNGQPVTTTNPLPTTAMVTVDNMEINAEMTEATGHDYYVTTTNVGDGVDTISFDAVAGLVLEDIIKVENKTQGAVYVTAGATITNTSIELDMTKQITGAPVPGVADEFEIVYRGTSRLTNKTQMSKITDGTNEVDVVVQDAAFGTTAKGLPLFGKYQAVPTTYADGDATPILTDANGRVVLESDIQLGAVELKNHDTDDRAIIKDGNTFAVSDDALGVADANTLAKLGTIETDIEATNTALGTVNTNLGTIETDIEATNTALGTVNTNLGTIETDIEATNTALGTVNTNLGTIETDIEAINTVQTNGTQKAQITNGTIDTGVITLAPANNLHGSNALIGASVLHGRGSASATAEITATNLYGSLFNYHNNVGLNANSLMLGRVDDTTVNGIKIHTDGSLLVKSITDSVAVTTDVETGLAKDTSIIGTLNEVNLNGVTVATNGSVLATKLYKNKTVYVNVSVNTGAVTVTIEHSHNGTEWYLHVAKTYTATTGLDNWCTENHYEYMRVTTTSHTDATVTAVITGRAI